MSTVLGILLTFFNYGQLPEIKIDDPGILSAFRIYLDSVVNDERTDATYHLVARVDIMGNRQFVYVQSVVSLSDFWGVVPDKYSRLDNSSIVFWYERERQMTDEENSKAFKEFAIQFEKDLINNMSPEGKEIHSEATKVLWRLTFKETYRFEIRENRVIHVKKLCGGFPDPLFYSYQVSYDIDGDPIYDDGVYDNCALDGSFTFNLAEDKDFDVQDYIRKRSGLPFEIFYKENFLDYLVTINEEGRVVKVEPVYPDEIDQEINLRLINTMLTMPKWNIGTIRGKKVSYRVLIGF